MKKYSILTIAFVTASVIGYAQQGITTAPNPSKNGEPVINGIPYSQYKAQQDALKNNSTIVPLAKDTKTITPVSNNKDGISVVSNNIVSMDKTSTIPVVDTKTSVVPVSSKLPVMSNQGGVVPVLIYTEPKVTPVSAKPVQVSTTKTGVQTTVPVPATQIIPAGSLKTSVPSQTPVTTTTSKPVEVNNNAAEAKLVAIPVVNIATSAETIVAPTTAPVKVEQVQIKQAPIQIEEIKPSVTPAAPKVPVVSMQNEKPKG